MAVAASEQAAGPIRTIGSMSFDEILRFLTQPPPLLSAAFGYFGGVVTLIFSPSIQQWANPAKTPSAPARVLL